MGAAHTHEWFLDKMSELHPRMTVIGIYTGCNKKVELLCHDCGATVYMTPASLINAKHRCNSCAAQNHAMTDEKLSKRLSDINPTIKLLSPFNGYKNKMKCGCVIHEDFEWFVTPSDLLKGRGCPECKKDTLHSHWAMIEGAFRERVEAENATVQYVGGFYNVMQKAIFRCRLCGEQWETVAANVLYSHSACPLCASSKGEKAIRQYLLENNIVFSEQATFEGCKGRVRVLPFDFFLPDYNILIEYQGIQHFQSVPFFGGESVFEERLALDTIKRDFAKGNGFTLLEISYRDYDKLSDILSAKLRKETQTDAYEQSA